MICGNSLFDFLLEMKPCRAPCTLDAPFAVLLYCNYGMHTFRANASFSPVPYIAVSIFAPRISGSNARAGNQA
jgi:hypothetical protein